MAIDRNAPATKGDVMDVESRLEMLRTEVQHGYNDLREMIRDTQTELLKAFYSFGQSK